MKICATQFLKSFHVDVLVTCRYAMFPSNANAKLFIKIKFVLCCRRAKKKKALYKRMKNLKGLCKAISTMYICKHMYTYMYACTKARIIETRYISWGGWGVDLSWSFRWKSSNRGMGLNFPWGSQYYAYKCKLSKFMKKLTWP